MHFFCIQKVKKLISPLRLLSGDYLMALECYSNAEKGKTAQKSQDSL
jgi:hypothetical protein